MSAYNHEYGQFDDDDPRVKDIFMNKVTSSTIESFIKSKDITTRFIPVKLASYHYRIMALANETALEMYNPKNNKQ